MKKLIISLLIATILFVMTGCTEEAKTMSFDTLEKMKAELGDTLLYPDVLPDSFIVDYSTLQGHFYSRGAKDYYINLRNRDFATDITNTEHFWQLNEGEDELAVAWVIIFAYEPKHNSTIFGTTRKTETAKYEELIAGGSIWEIDDVTVARNIDFIRNEVGYLYTGTDEVEKNKRENVSPEYYDYTAYALFMYDNILYTVDMKIYGRADIPEDEMREMCDGEVKTVVSGMIN